MYLRVSLFVIYIFVTQSSGTQLDQTLKYHILEELAANTLIGNVATDAKLDERYTTSIVQNLRFSFLPQSSSNHGRLFAIEETSGIIRTDRVIDRDTLCPLQTTCYIHLDVAVKPVQYFQVLKVVVDILDINDNKPNFHKTQLNRRLSESSAPGVSLPIPTAQDPDSASYAIQHYELVSSSSKFELKVINSIDGSTDLRLVLKEKLDRESVDFYQVKVVAHDGGVPSKSGSVLINITVEDANDNRPKFDNITFEVPVDENIPIHSTIVQVTATDKDIGQNGVISYRFSSRTNNTFGHLFGVRNRTGEIYVKQRLDFEKKAVYHLIVSASDLGPGAVPVHATVIVNVQDLNDNAPQINVNTLTSNGLAQISESSPVGTFVAHISVIDKDSGQNGKFNCSVGNNNFQLVQLYQTEYKLATAVTLDREVKAIYYVLLECHDFGETPQRSNSNLTVIVLDENDHSPKFSQGTYYASIQENNYPNSFVIRVNATDSDQGQNGGVRYSIQGQTSSLFNINSRTGHISAKVVFDREQIERVDFLVVASDDGTPPNSGTATVSLQVLDLNDEKPVFFQQHYAFGIFENLPSNTEVGSVLAKDRDSPPHNSIIYSLDQRRSDFNSFSIHPNTGHIFTRRLLDRETQPVFYLVIIARNPGTPPQSSTCSVSIYVADKNDNSPIIDFPSVFNNTVYVSNLVPLGYVFTRVQARDIDVGGNAKLTFAISAGNQDSTFSIDQSTGSISINTQFTDIDNKLFHLTIIVKDHGYPQMTSVGYLNVVVNKTIAFIEPEDLVHEENFIIVLCLAIVSGFLVLVLVVAIVIIRKQDRAKKQGGAYNCRITEAEQMLSPLASKDKQLADGKDSPKTSVTLTGNGTIAGMQETRLCTDNQSDLLGSRLSVLTRQSWAPSEDSHNSQNPSLHGNTSSRSNEMQSKADPIIRGNPILFPSNTNTIPRVNDPPRHRLLAASSRDQSQTLKHSLTGTQREMEVHQLLQLLKRDPDAESACSGETSNTDSGHCASEEGDHAVVSPSHTSFVPLRTPMRKSSQALQVQVVVHCDTDKKRTKCTPVSVTPGARGQPLFVASNNNVDNEVGTDDVTLNSHGDCDNCNEQHVMTTFRPRRDNTDNCQCKQIFPLPPSYEETCGCPVVSQESGTNNGVSVDYVFPPYKGTLGNKLESYGGWADESCDSHSSAASSATSGSYILSPKFVSSCMDQMGIIDTDV